MKLGMFVNEVEQEKPEYTTTRLALAATQMGHDVYYVGAGDFSYQPNDAVQLCSKRAPEGSGSREEYLEAVQSNTECHLDVAELDVLMLRNDPAEDISARPWAAATHIVFGHIAQSLGVAVVNDPAGLARAANKLYLQEFPPHVRPKTLIARDEEEIKSFVEDIGGRAVLKPLLGAKGDRVFFAQGPDDPNLNQFVEAVKDQGYVVVQEFLEAAKDGDVRMFLLDGKPLEKDGRYAAFRRRPADDELRSNMSAGGTAEAFEVSEKELAIVEAVGPKLREDGMFLAGLDIVGDKLVEANVETPGGLESVQRLTGIDFAPVIVQAMEDLAA